MLTFHLNFGDADQYSAPGIHGRWQIGLAAADAFTAANMAASFPAPALEHAGSVNANANAAMDLTFMEALFLRVKVSSVFQ